MAFGSTLAQLALTLGLGRLRHLSLSHLHSQALQNLGDISITRRNAQAVLHGHRAPALLLANEVHHGALGSGPTGTTRTMHVVLDVLGRIHMQHQIYTLHMQSPCHQVGGHQNLHFTIGPRPQGTRPTGLRESTVEVSGGDTEITDLVGRALRSEAVLHKHQRLTSRTSQRGRHIQLVVVAYLHPQMFPRQSILIQRSSNAFSAVMNGILLVLLDELAHITVKGGREQQHLGGAMDFVEQLAYLGHESHVAHPVGFVDDHDFHSGQIGVTSSHKIGHTPRSRHRNCHTSAQCIDLAIDVLSAHEGLNPPSPAASERNQRPSDLLGQFAHGDQDQRLGAPRLTFAHPSHDGQAVGQRLTRPSGRLSAYVEACQAVRKRGCLYRERRSDAELIKLGTQVRRNTELGKGQRKLRLIHPGQRNGGQVGILEERLIWNRLSGGYNSRNFDTSEGIEHGMDVGIDDDVIGQNCGRARREHGIDEQLTPLVLGHGRPDPKRSAGNDHTQADCRGHDTVQDIDGAAERMCEQSLIPII